MDPTPSKKRKTLPTTSVPSGAPSTTPRRPSFASPTKASIARGYPQLLDRPRSSENAEGNIGETGTPGRHASQPSGTLRNVRSRRSTRSRSPQPAQTSQLPEEAEFNPFKPTRALARDHVAPAQEAHPSEDAEINPFKPTRTLVRDPVVPALELQKPADQSLATPSPPRQSAVLRRSPRISPGVSTEVVRPTTEAAIPVTEPARPQPADEQPNATRLEPSAVRSGTGALRRSPRISSPIPTSNKVASINLRVENAEEPELPPTPTQRGLKDPVVTTPPPGIHNTPSKSRRPRSRGKGNPVKSSPLKPKATPLVEPEEQLPEKNLPEKRDEEAAEKEERPYPTRHEALEDKHAAKRKIRNSLLKELEQLQEDVEVAERENSRLYEQQASGRKTLELLGTSNLASLFQRTIAPDTKPKPPKSSFHSIASFLPFAGRRRKPSAEIKDTPIASHAPVAQENSLPFLRLFTPLTFESTISILPPVEPSTPEYLPDTLQKHVIYASSGNGLLSARTNLVVNTTSHSIISLEVESLSPLAQSELGVFAKSCVEKKDAGSFFWALGRWYEVSLRRAKFWCAVEADYGEGMKVIESGIKHEKRGRKRKVLEQEGEERDEGEEKKWSRKELARHMGRRKLVLKGQGVELMVQWGISFDWTGEAESNISADAKVMQNWHEGDDRKSLDRIPQTFSKLVESFGPAEAVRTIVALLSKE